MSPFTRKRARTTWSLALLCVILFSSSGVLVVLNADAAAADTPLIISAPVNGSLIRVTNPVFSGTAYGADTVRVSTSEGPGCTAVVSQSNSWTCQVAGLTTRHLLTVTATSNRSDSHSVAPSDVQSGTSQFSTTSEQNDARPGSATVSYAVLLPPTIAGAQGGFTSTNPQPTFSGGADPEATVTVTVAGSGCTDVADGSGYWTCTVAPALPDGPRYDRLVDVVRATQSPSWSPALSSDPATTFYFLLPQQLPDPTFTSPVNTAAGATTAYLTDSRPPLTGTAQPGARVVISYGLRESSEGAIYCRTVANGLGVVSCAFAGPIPMTSGHTYYIRARQDGSFAHGSSGSTDLFYLTIIDPPTVPVISSPAAGSETSDATVSVTGTGDPGSTIHVLVDGTPACQAVTVGTDWMCTTPTLALGGHDLTAYTTDQHGNVSAAAVSRTITILSPPVPPTIVSPVNGYTSSQPGLVVTGDGTNGTTIDVVIDGGLACETTVSDGQWTCTIGPLTPGGHVLSVTAIDGYGTGSDSTAENISIVGPPVATSITNPVSPYESSQRSITVSGTGSTGDSVQVMVDESAACTVPVQAGTWNCVLTGLSIGSHTVTAIATDGFGSASAASPGTTMMIDAPPSAPLISAPGAGFTTFARTVTVSGSSMGSTIHVVVDNAEACTATSPANGSWQCTTPALALGKHTLYAYSVDGYGTPSTASPSVKFRIATPPGATVAVPVQPTVVSQPASTTPPPGDSRLAITGNSPTRHHLILVVPAGSVNAPNTFSFRLHFPDFSKVSPLSAAVTGGVAGGFLLLVVFPAELLKNTIRENYERAFGWLAPLRRLFARVGRRAARIHVNEWVGGAAIILVAAVALSFAEPGFGFNASSARLFVALVLSLSAVNVISPAVTRGVARRWFATPMTVRPLPAALLLVLASALISRFAHIEPGFLYAGVIGIAFGAELDRRSEGILALVAIVVTATLGLGAWIGYAAIAPAAEAHPNFWNLLWSEALSATTIEALATLAVALLPLKFLDGSKIFAWKRWAWAVAYFFAILILIFVIAPISDNWGPEIAPLFGWGVFFIVFAVVAVGIWVMFRFRPAAGRQREGTGQ